MACHILYILASILPYIIKATSHYAHLLEERIVNGVPISAAEYPWMVSIRDINVTGGYSNPHYCGGSLIQIEPNPVILTAAHCVEDYILNKTSGNIYSLGDNGNFSFGYPTYIALDLNRTIQQRQIEPWNISFIEDDQYNTLYVYDANMIYIHPKYNSSGNGIFDGYDIALFVIDDNQTVDIDIDPLPTIPMQLDSLEKCCYSGESLTQIGYGINATNGSLTKTLESTVLSYIDGVDCINQFKAAGNKSIFGATLITKYPDQIPNKFVCAMGNNTDSCQGDSGGPLFNIDDDDDDGSIEIVGVVSFGEGCAAGYPGFWTSTGHFYNWIENVIDGITTTENPSIEPTMSPSMEPTTSPQSTTTSLSCDGQYKIAQDCPVECEDDALCRECNWQNGAEICSRIDETCQIIFEDCQCKEVFKDENGNILNECDTPTADDCVILITKINIAFIIMMMLCLW